MAKFKVSKAGKSFGSVGKAKVGDFKAGAVDFELQDNQDGSYDVHGVTAAGNRADISGLATLTVVSSDPAIITVDPPTGMHVVTHAVGPLGTATLKNVATWNDGSMGPFEFDLPGNVKAGPVSGLEVELGTPTAR